ncbi:hypothetical protein PICSAR202_03872 [Mycobacterium avium subsp. paratuberculosis]|nr:hypothetical protein PICSAR202_03872 [Mycobacterium avium subsp. paratuberculosis]
MPAVGLLRLLRRPARRPPARRRTVVGLGGALPITALVGVRTVAAVGVSVGLQPGGRGGLAGPGDGRLEGRLGGGRGPRLAALDGQFAGCLDRRLVRRDTATEIVEHREPGPLFDAREDALQLSAVQRLLLQQLARQRVEDVAVFGEDLPGLSVGGLDQLADLVVDVTGDLVRVVGLGAHGAAEERVAVFRTVFDRTEFGAHAELGDHRAGDLGGLLDVGHRAGGRLAEDQLLGGAATHREHQLRDHLRAGAQALVLLGHRDRVPAGAAARQDRHLVDGFDVGHRPGRQRVAALVVGGDLLFLLADDAALAARPADHPVDRFLQSGAGDDGAVLACGQQRRLVDHVGQVGAGHADGALGQAVEVGVGGDRLALGMHRQHRAAAGQVRVGNRDLAVEAAGPQQRRVQDVGPVGGGDQDHAGPRVEPVHLDQQLVQRLLALVVTAAQAGAALASHRVDLVDEDDARVVLFGLVEQVTNPGRAHPDEHLDEVGPGDGEERNPGLAGHRPGQQRLTGAGWPVEQHALGDLGAQRLIAARVLQEVLDLVELLDRLVDPGDVGERGLGHVLGELFGPRLSEPEAHPGAALHAREHHEQPDQQQQGQHVHQQLAQDAALVDDRADLRVLGAQRVEQVDRVAAGIFGDDLVGVVGVAVALLQGQAQLLFAVVDLRALDVVAIDLGHRHRGVDGLIAAGVVAEVEERPAEQHHDSNRRDGANNVFPVHQSSALTGRVLPRYTRSWKSPGYR